jgi:hypothetical protein
MIELGWRAAVNVMIMKSEKLASYGGLRVYIHTPCYVNSDEKETETVQKKQDRM